MRLETVTLVLRDWEQADLSDLVEGLNDLSVSRWLAFVPHPYTEKEAQLWIDFCTASSQSPGKRTVYEFAIELKSGKRVIGGVGLTQVSSAHGTAGGGIWLNVKYQSHGFGREAFAEKIRFAFEDLNLRRLDNSFFKRNSVSLAMQERFG